MTSGIQAVNILTTDTSTTLNELNWHATSITSRRRAQYCYDYSTFTAAVQPAISDDRARGTDLRPGWWPGGISPQGIVQLHELREQRAPLGVCVCGALG